MKIKFYLMLALLLIGSLCYAVPPGSGWNLVWADDFNGSSVNTSNWSVHNRIDYDKDGRQSYFRSQNCKVVNGELQIHNYVHSPSLPNGAEYTGGWLQSHKKFTYGYFEVECRINWWHQRIWPTFWLWSGQGNDIELDVMEFSKWHIFPSQTHHFNGGRTVRNSSTKLDELHKWAVLWTPDEVSFYIDNVKQFSSDRPDLARNKNIPMILSSSPNRDLQPPMNTTSLPMFQVKYVRVWQGGNPGTGSGTQKVSLQGNNGKHVTSSNGNGPIYCDRGPVLSWEKFEWVDLGGGKTGLKGVKGQGRAYVSSENGTKAMTCNRSNAGAWEKFTVEHHGNQVYAFKGNNGKYISLKSNNELRCDAGSVGATEKFKVAWGLKSAQGATTNQELTVNRPTMDIYLFPNPTTNAVIVHIAAQEKVRTFATLEIISLNGSLAKSVVVPTNTEHEIDISDLSKGMYIVKSENSAVQKLIIE